jgi:hypothetical protein
MWAGKARTGLRAGLARHRGSARRRIAKMSPIQTPMAANEKALGTTRFLALFLLFPLGTGTTEEVLQHVRL